MATPPPPRPLKRKYTGPIQEGIKRFKAESHTFSVGAGSLVSSGPSAVPTAPSLLATTGSATTINPSSTHSHILAVAGRSTTSTLMGFSPTPTAAVTGAKPGITEDIKYEAVAGIELALQALHLSAGPIPDLKPAVDGLIDCLDVMEAATSSTEECDEIIPNLKLIDDKLKEYLGELGLEDPSGNHACALIASSIEKEVLRIKKQQGHNKVRGAPESAEDNEDVMRCYQRVERLFQQLQGNICLQTFKNVNKEHLTSLLDRLHPVADARYDSRYSTTVRRRGCTRDTREQVQKDLQSWVQDQNGARIYWMNGMAGTGKTTIAYSLCRWLEAQKQLGASFFCSRLSSSCRNVDSIVPTIAYELARYSPAFRAELGKVLEEDPNTSGRDVNRQFEKLIQRPMMLVKDAIPHGVAVVIDALDECEDVHRVELILQALLHFGINLPLKYFIASRPEPAILERMLGLAEHSRAVLHLHDIEQWIVEEDIKKYLEEELCAVSPPPDVKQIDQLAKLADKLFIYAATVTRYILPGAVAVNSAARLKAVIAAGSPTANKGGSAKKYKQLDELYATVLAAPLDEDILEPEEVEVVRLVLWTVVCAEEPMAIPTLSSFLSLDEAQVLSVIKSLRSVLYLSESNGFISTLHASFPDYMLDRSRCGKYYCDPFQYNELLAHRCFEIMKGHLRFNICSLKSSFVFDKDVVDLEARIANNVPHELSYACLYWGRYLHRAGVSSTLCDVLYDFLSYRLLFWMEVLSLKQRIGHGETVLSQVLAWLSTGDESTKLRDFTYDARDLLTTFAGNPTSWSTPHIYVSSLPSTSKRSLVQKAYLPRMRGLIGIDGEIIEGKPNLTLATWAAGSGVSSIAQSSDGKWIASGSQRNETSLWDVSSGTRITEPLKGHDGHVWTVAFSPDDTLIASGSADHTVRIWDAYSGNSIGEPLCGHTSDVKSVAFSPDGTLIASGSRDHTIRMWDARTGVAMGDAYKGHKDTVLSISFSPKGEHLASGSEDWTIRVWNWRTGAAVRGPKGGYISPVYSIAYSSDGLRLVSGSRDGRVRVWNMTSGALLAGPFNIRKKPRH